jgi:hypothetical protein
MMRHLDGAASIKSNLPTIRWGPTRHVCAERVMAFKWYRRTLADFPVVIRRAPARRGSGGRMPNVTVAHFPSTRRRTHQVS